VEITDRKALYDAIVTRVAAADAGASLDRTGLHMHHLITDDQKRYAYIICSISCSIFRTCNHGKHYIMFKAKWSLCTLKSCSQVEQVLAEIMEDLEVQPVDGQHLIQACGQLQASANELDQRKGNILANGMKARLLLLEPSDNVCKLHQPTMCLHSSSTLFIRHSVSSSVRAT
jgi:hypothetical protein